MKFFRRNTYFCAVIFGIYLLFASLSYAATSPKKVALVIGNSSYEFVPNLPNPSNDATDIGASLERLGFDVTSGIDLSYKKMRLMLRDFSEQAESAAVALIYFAGHGVEIDKINYLIPVNAQLKSDRDIEFEAVQLDTILHSIGSSQGLKIVLIDACRNNPFLASMTRTSATRSVGHGLTRIDPGGILVGYSARGGTLALDWENRNSPYAKALLYHLEQPGLEVGKLFRKVRDQVYNSTSGSQEPFTYGSLPGNDVYLKAPLIISESHSDVELAFQSTADSVIISDFANAEKYDTVHLWKTFLSKYDIKHENPLLDLPNPLVRLARKRLKFLEKESEILAKYAKKKK